MIHFSFKVCKFQNLSFLEPSCKDPESLNNSGISNTSKLISDTVTYTCNRGYWFPDRSFHTEFQCNSSLHWSALDHWNDSWIGCEGTNCFNFLKYKNLIKHIFTKIFLKSTNKSLSVLILSSFVVVDCGHFSDTNHDVKYMEGVTMYQSTITVACKTNYIYAEHLPNYPFSSQRWYHKKSFYL